MTIYFSKSASGFFIDGVHTNIPADKVPIALDVWQHLIAGQSPASVISADAAGNPILVDPQNGNAILYSSVGQT